jgi:hypothetical protein
MGGLECCDPWDARVATLRSIAPVHHTGNVVTVFPRRKGSSEPLRRAISGAGEQTTVAYGATAHG